MRFLVHSNAPWVKTGYGVQTRYLVERLHDAGHEVAVSTTYGIQGEVMPWGPRQIRCYPAGYEMNGVDVIHNHAMHWFDGDERNGWIIPLLDLWCLTPNTRLADFNIAGWCPVDHFPVPPDVLKFFHRNPDAIPIAMSRYGERQLAEAGLDPVYIPLAVDTGAYKPTPTLEVAGKTITGRELIGQDDPIPEDAFLVGMVAMNKGWARDRKGFNEALRAFGQFWLHHQDAILYMHCDWPGGAEGIQLKELAIHASVPEHAIRWVDQYAYRMGFTPEMMAATYTAMDVLLAPSHGEGFCVPLVEAQACGTPVITTDFSTGPELCGAGWLAAGQLEWDPAQHSSYICPYTLDVIAKLEEAFNADREAMADQAVQFAAQYDADRVFQSHWLPFLAELEAPVEPLVLEREPMESVAVIVPAMREANLPRLIDSFDATSDGTADLIVIQDDGDNPTVYRSGNLTKFASGKTTSTYAEKVNLAAAVGDELSGSPHDWLLLVGDDVEFKPGWIEAARKLSTEFDVIGTNDSSNGVKNPDVASGRHADHFFVRRSYIDTYGACLDGPGVLAPECYGHWYVDKEMIELAKARGVFTPCLESVIEHHHPGYAGREDLRAADPVYVKAQESAEADRQTFMSRLPLIAMAKTGRGR